MNYKKVITITLAVAVFVSINILVSEAETMNTHNTKKGAVKVAQTAGRNQYGDFAPDFARYNDDILFGEVWSRNDKLSLHDRSIVTLSALITNGISGNLLRYHMETAKKNGVTKDEIVDIIIQPVFYSGWTKAWGAMDIAKDIYSVE